MPSLDLDGSLDSLALLLSTSNSLGAHDTTTPVASGVLVLVGVAFLDGRKELREFCLVLLTNVGDGEDRRSLESV